MDGNSTDEEVTFREVSRPASPDVADDSVSVSESDDQRTVRLSANGNDASGGTDATTLTGVLRDVVATLGSVKQTIGALGRRRSPSPGRSRQQPRRNRSPEADCRTRTMMGEPRRDANNSHHAEYASHWRPDPYDEWMRRHQYERGDDRRYSERPPRAAPKLPSYSGTENWAVWIAKFEAIANRYHWGTDDRLDHLLPKLEGLAGEFAFTQLQPHVLNNYDLLVAEMTNRFRVIETAQSYAVKLNRRVQKHSETAEDFAADLKCLYDKAHRNRDRHTRDEDLVRRFFDGLLDQDARFAVEFNKSPNNIDEAVFHVVNYKQMRSCARVDRNRFNVRRAADETEVGDETSDKRRCQRPERISRPFPTQAPVVPEVDAEIQRLQQRIRWLESRRRGQRPATKTRRGECYNCHEVGHFARDCPRRTEAAPSGNHRDAVARSEPLNFRGPALEARGGSA